MVDVVEVIQQGFVGMASEKRSDRIDLPIHNDQHTVVLSRIDGIFLQQLFFVTLQNGFGFVTLSDDLPESTSQFRQLQQSLNRQVLHLHRMIVRAKLQTNKPRVVRNQPKVESMYLYLVRQSYFMQLIHAEVINFWDEIHDIPFCYGSTLIPQHNGVDGFDSSDDGIQHEDECPSLEVINRLRIILKQDYLVIAYQIPQFELIGEVQQLQQIVVDHQYLFR